MSVTYHYWRHYGQYSEEIDTLHQALYRARTDTEDGFAYAEAITLEDGTKLDNEEIMQRSGFYSDVTGMIIEGSITEL